MTRYNLDELPQCGAKTKNSGKCQRKGSKKNGRCRLHGGDSTGPKTESGKMASRMNALSLFPMDHMGQPIRREYVVRAYKAYDKLIELMLKSEIHWESVFEVIEAEKIPLEMLKYHLMSNHDSAALIYIQTALDMFYMESDASHLAFHIYSPILTMPQFGHYLSKPIKRYHQAFITRINKRYDKDNPFSR